MTTLPLLAGRAFNRPLWVEPHFGELVASILGPRLNLTVNVNTLADQSAQPPRQPARDPMITKAGIMVLPVVGGLAHRGDAMDAECGGLMSYTLLNNRLVSALENPDVRGILLDIDSPGGEAGGCFEFGDTILDARKEKPIFAVANARACSAAYMIGSSASKFFCTPSGEVGSIGVCWLHADMSGALEKAGVVTTWLFAGKHKVDGNPYEKLSRAAREDFEKSIGESYDLFVAQVAARRPMSPEAIRKTEARVFGAAESAELGLVDGVLSFQGALDALESELNSARAPGVLVKTGEAMTTATTTPPANAPVDTAALDAARAEGYKAGRADAAQILGSPEAKGREALAAKLAANPAMSADAAEDLLKSSPVATAAAPKRESRLDAAMDKHAAKVDAGTEPADGEDRDTRLAQIKSVGKAASTSRYRYS